MCPKTQGTSHENVIWPEDTANLSKSDDKMKISHRKGF